MTIPQAISQNWAKSLGLVLVAAILMKHEAIAQTVNLGTADSFAVLAGAGITNTGATTISGNVGSFGSSTATSGFGTVTLNGANHGGDAVTQQAKIDLVTAYNDAAGRPGSAAPADLVGLTLVAGVYNNPALGLTGVLTLNAQGNHNAVWIFQSGSSLIVANNSSVVLINGAQACMVFWQVTSSATIGTGSNFAGNVLALTSIQAQTGATVNGRLLAQTGSVTLEANTIARAICEVINNGPKKDTGRTVSIAEIRNALIRAAQAQNLVSVTELTSAYTLGFGQFDSEVLSVQQRLADIRSEARASGVPDVNSVKSVPSEKNPRGGKSPGGKNSWSGKGGEGVQPAQVEMSDDTRWGVFITGTGDFATVGDTDSANGFHGNSFGTTLGVDCRVSDQLVVGVSVGYAHSDLDLIADGKLKADGGKAALYAMYHAGGFYTEGLIGGGYNSYDTKRSAFLGNAYGSTSGGQFDAYLGVGYDVKLGSVFVTPMASLLYTLVGIDGFDERGSLVPLHVESQHGSSLRSRVGPRVSFTRRVGAANVTPSVSAQWQHEFLDDELPLNARSANGAGSLFTVHGPKIGRDSALLTAALNIAWSRYAAYLAYQADLGRENYENETVLVGFRVSW